MIKADNFGRYVLSQEVTGVIRRIPIESRGTSKSGREWVLGKMVLEVFEDGVEGSAQIYLTTFDPDLTETIQRIGVGKRVRVRFHVETKEYYDSYRTNLIVDAINGVTEGEDYVYGTFKTEA